MTNYAGNYFAQTSVLGDRSIFTDNKYGNTNTGMIIAQGVLTGAGIFGLHKTSHWLRDKYAESAIDALKTVDINRYKRKADWKNVYFDTNDRFEENKKVFSYLHEYQKKKSNTTSLDKFSTANKNLSEWVKLFQQQDPVRADSRQNFTQFKKTKNQKIDTTFKLPPNSKEIKQAYGTVYAFEKVTGKFRAAQEFAEVFSGKKTQIWMAAVAGATILGGQLSYQHNKPYRETKHHVKEIQQSMKESEMNYGMQLRGLYLL